MNQRTRCSPNLARLKAFTAYLYDNRCNFKESGIPKADARVYEKSFLNLPYIAGLGMIIFLENEKKNLRRTKMKKKKLEENKN